MTGVKIQASYPYGVVEFLVREVESSDARNAIGSRPSPHHGCRCGGNGHLPEAQSTSCFGIHFGWGSDWAEQPMDSFGCERGGDSDFGRVGGDSSHVFRRTPF